MIKDNLKKLFKMEDKSKLKYEQLSNVCEDFLTGKFNRVIFTEKFYEIKEI